MHYDIVLHNGKLHVCGSPVSMSESDVLEAFNLPDGVFVYGSDYPEEAEEIKKALELMMKHDLWDQLVDLHKKIKRLNDLQDSLNEFPDETDSHFRHVTLKDSPTYYLLAVHKGGLYVLECDMSISMRDNLIIHEKEYAHSIYMTRSYDKCWAMYEHITGGNADEFGGVHVDAQALASIEREYEIAVDITTGLMYECLVGGNADEFGGVHVDVDAQALACPKGE